MQEEVSLYKELNVFIDSLNKLSVKEIDKLDSLVINIDKKYGVVQKEYWKLLEHNEELNNKFKIVEKERNSYKSSRNKWRIIGAITSTVAGIFVYKSLK